MPELPEVEAIRANIEPEVARRRILAVHVERASATRPQAPARLARLAAGRTIRGVRRRGKNLLIDLSGDLVIRIHLRMTGRLHAGRAAEISKSTRVWLELGGGRKLVFDDPRALGAVHILAATEAERIESGLGPEPLSAQFTPDRFLEAAARSRQPAKLFLMDQKRVAGLGNIYAAEALFRARIHPARPINRVLRPKLQALFEAIRSVLREAVRSAKIAYNHRGRFHEAERFVRAVYGRAGESCPRCGKRIRRIEQGGRSTYYCPGCQT